VRRICDRYGVLLIMDEVINGWGRTGRLFAAEHFDVVPDIMVMAKGLSSGYMPIAATVVRPALYADFKEHEARLTHLLTFGGHAVASAVALKNIEILLRERLVENSAKMGERMLRGLQELVDRHPSVGDARGKGLMCALDLVRDKETREPWGKDSAFTWRLTEVLAERGVLVRILGDLNLAPPLIITADQVDELTGRASSRLGLLERCALPTLTHSASGAASWCCCLAWSTATTTVGAWARLRSECPTICSKCGWWDSPGRHA
jgi:adenosylmethionine-8-amino-7-oxononanoate aminotransferase